MTKVKAVTATILAGAVSFALFQSSGSAQPNLPEAPGVQQKAEQNVQEQAQDVEARTTGKADVETKAADVDANAKAKAKAKTTDRAEARAKNRANAQGEQARNKARAKVDADLNDDVEADAELNSEAQVDANRKDRQRARMNADADANLGFEFADDDSNDLTISAVSDNSFATRAGLRQGDRIVSIDGRTFRSRDAMVRFMNRNQNRQFPITYLRNDQRYSVNVTPQMFAQRGNNRQPRAAQYGSFGTTFVDNGQQGVWIDQVHEGSPAHQAGLQSGDQIICFNGWSYQNGDQFTTYSERFPRDRALPMTYVRDGQYHSAQVTLSDQNFEGTARLDNEGRDLPPAPGPAYDRDEQIADVDSAVERRTTLRPNFDELSNDQLRQEVQQLRRENKNLRQQLNNLRQNRATDDTESAIDSREATESRDEIREEAEEAPESVDEIEDARDIDAETETEVELKTDASEEVETP